MRVTIAVILELHQMTVGRELVECRCAWICKRGPGAGVAINRHLEDELVEALVAAGHA